MSYTIEWSAPALRELRKLDKPLGRRILTAVTKLGVDLKDNNIPQPQRVIFQRTRTTQ